LFEVVVGVNFVSHCDIKNEAMTDSSQTLLIHVLTAKYGPCEFHSGQIIQELLDGEHRNDRIVVTRDVTPFVRAILLAQQSAVSSEGRARKRLRSNEQDASVCRPWDGLPSGSPFIRLNAIGKGGMIRSCINVLEGQEERTDGAIHDETNTPKISQKPFGMNAVFGDPCPGISKRLDISYLLHERTPDESTKSSLVYRVSFAEHEPVILHRHHDGIRQATQMDVTMRPMWTTPLSVETTEVFLPLTMPFLQIRERVQCRAVCRLWQKIVQNYGVATRIDYNNRDEYFSSPTTTITRPFLRGLLSHSHASLHSLYLSGMIDLEPSDLLPAIPHLQQLRSLDISRCELLGDETMHALATHTTKSLQVLYIKNLRRVTDDGVVAITEGCKNLRVLEISFIPLTDVAGVAIGQNLPRLQALYMRDNYHFTNRSIDVITRNCTKLEQLTLWGTIQLTHLDFSPITDALARTTPLATGRLVVLNLWGCYNLGDDIASALGSMSETLSTLILSECHRLSDSFVVRVMPVS
jgi:hypothetical protein